MSINQSLPTGPRAAEGYRILQFLGGTPLTVPENACRGCVMNALEAELPKLLAPVYDDGTITVRQDAEWAVPGFMVVAVRPHLGGVDQMDLPLVHRLATVTHFVRRAMRTELGLAAVQTYQEDKLDRPHYHAWMLPLWPQMMVRHQINPRIYESNIARYLSLFTLAEHEAQIRVSARCIGAYLDQVPELRAPHA